MVNSILLLALMLSPFDNSPYASIREGYAKRDANIAVSAYAEDGKLINRYDNTPEETFNGKGEIASTLNKFFELFDDKEKIDINFRTSEIIDKKEKGFYRIKVGGKNYYGGFETIRGNDNKFQTDISLSATMDDFEGASGEVMFSASEEIREPAYYSRFTGRYNLGDGCQIIITLSQTRLFSRNSCSNEWRGLNRISGKEWSFGSKVIDRQGAQKYVFSDFISGRSPSLKIIEDQKETVAHRTDVYSIKEVVFKAPDGIELSGNLYMPNHRSAKLPATVMVHGSGPQDRNGYASIIALMADALAANGHIVLAFDKRGSGASGGDGDRASFDVLAGDAVSGMQYLASLSETDTNRIGVAGSSQAGWVSARIVEKGANPAHVLLLGAAGSAMSVREQNLYNTDVLMRCSGLKRVERQIAIRQQKAFFDFLDKGRNLAELDSITRIANQNERLRDWIFPNSSQIDRSSPDWYNVLSLEDNPINVWKKYRGKSLFIFGEYDDSTPTNIALSRLSNTRIKTEILPKSQHLGLEANSECQADLDKVSRFSPVLFKKIESFAAPNS